MVKFFIVFLWLSLVTIASYSQSTCNNAAPFCTSTGVNFPASTTTSAPFGPNYGCLGSQPNPAWFFLNIATSGNLTILLTNSSNVDIDFAAWGPFATQAAMTAAVCGGASGTPISCSFSAAANETVFLPNTVTGQWYMLLITNFSGQPTNISAATSPSSAGSTNCGILCTITNLTAVPSLCDSLTNTYSISGSVSTSNIPTTGTLTISSSCGGSTVLNPPFAAVINYNLTGLSSNGAACVVTASYSAVSTCTLAQNYTAPLSCSACQASNTGPYCVGDTIQLSNLGNAPYNWTGPNGFSSTLQSPTVIATTTTMSGVYNITAGPCISNTNVIINPVPIVSITPPIAVCDSANMLQTNFVSSLPNTAFTWTNSDTTIGLPANGNGSVPGFVALNNINSPVVSTISVTPTASTTGCIGNASTYTITVTPNPSVDSLSDIVVCNNEIIDSTNFTSTVIGATFSWTNSNPNIGLSNNGNGNVPTFIATNLTSSPISATINVVASLNGCVGAVTTYTITVNPTPIVNVLQNIQMCADSSISTINFLSTTIGTVFNWTNQDTTIGLGSFGNDSIASFIALNNTSNPITSNVSVTPTANNCVGLPVIFEITVNPTPVMDFLPNIIICEGEKIGPINFVSNVAGSTFSWINSNPLIGLSASGTGNSIPLFNATNLTANPITATIKISVSANGCIGDTSTFTITINPIPDVIVPLNIELCNGSEVPFIDFSSTTLGTTFFWTNSDSSIGLGAIGAGDIAAFNAINTGSTPVVSIIIVSPTANGCNGLPTDFSITVNPSPITDFSPTNACVNRITNLNDLSTANGGVITNWNWDFNNDNIIDHLFPNPNFVFTTQPNQSVSLSVTNSNGCSDTITKLITVNPTPVANFSFSPTYTDILNSNIFFTNLSSFSTTWNWNFNDGDTSSMQHPSHEFLDTGIYFVTLFAENIYGCTDTITKAVKINPSFALFIPNAFSPDGNNINDYFFAKGFGIAQLETTIFNRWGEVIFEGYLIDSKWDGTYKGDLVEPGTYAYKIKVIDDLGVNHEYVGKVSIIY